MRNVLTCLAFLSFIVFLTGAAAQDPPTPTLLWQFQGIEDVNAFAALPDADGDGGPDIVLETYDAGADGDHLYLITGASDGTGRVIWSARPESGASNGGGYRGECLVSCDDLGGDGFPDVLLGTAWGNRSVHAIDGLSGSVLWTFDTYDEPNSGWVYTVRAHPDRTGDGHPEVVFGGGSENHRGYLLDGSDGSIIWRFIGSSDAIGHTVSLPDMNDDDIADVLFCGWDNEDRVFCVSGAGEIAGTQIWSHDSGSSNYTATVIDDINDDGVAEIVIGTWQASNQVICLDGASGGELWSFHNGSYNYIMRLVTVDDLDQDGIRDVAVGSFSNGLPVVSGRDGSLIWISYAGTINGGDFWTVDGTADIDGDGLGEVVGGSFDKQVYLFSGADGDTLWTFDTGNRLYSVFGAPDISGNGTVDVMGGSQYLSGGGRAYALEGGDGITAVPDLPEAAGSAVRLTQATELNWQLSAPLPCVVDRLVDDGTKARQARLDLAESFARREMDTREVLTAIVETGKAAQTVRLTAEPLLPGETASNHWDFRLIDDTDTSRKAAYRVSVILPDGREATVLELRPAADTAPVPVGLAARLAPNPFNPRTEVQLALDRETTVSVDIHDAAGRKVARLGPRGYTAGNHTLAWNGTAFDGRALPTGIYLLHVRAGASSQTLKATLVR